MQHNIPPSPEGAHDMSPCFIGMKRQLVYKADLTLFCMGKVKTGARNSARESTQQKGKERPHNMWQEEKKSMVREAVTDVLF